MTLAARQMKGVDQTGRSDDRRPVLIVVKHRNIEQLTQPLLNDEALGRLDVFEVDAAKSRVQKAHAVDELVDIARVDFEIDRVDVRKALEQRAFAFHHRLGGERAEITQSQDRSAVRDHRNKIALRSVVEGCARLALDVEARERYTR